MRQLHDDDEGTTFPEISEAKYLTAAISLLGQ